MGKYDKVLATLPRTLGTEPAYQQKVEAVKAIMRSEGPMHGSALAYTYAQIREEKDVIEEQLSVVNLQLEAISQLMAEQFENEGTTAIGLENGAKVSIHYEPTGKVEDKEAFRLWCIENGLEKSLQLWPSTMIALLKERLLAGEDAPDGVTAAARRVIRFSKG